MKTLDWAAYRKLDGVIFLSESIRKEVSAVYRFSRQCKAVCYIGVSSHPSEERPRHAKEQLILFVGGNFERKGLPTVLKAMPQVFAAYPQYRLVVVGKAPGVERAKRMASDLGIGSRVEFIGYQTHEQVQEWHRRAMLFVMPSIMEGFGFVFLEAMKAGTPVVGTHTGGIPEVVVHDQSGLLIPPRDHQTLAKSCIRLLGDAGLYERLVLGGRGAVRRFSEESMVGDTERFLKEMVARWPQAA
jgi:glycosyltransferase involved in cell wall biosynthesis